MKDPTYDALVADLRRLRTQPGLPTAARLNVALALVDDLGQGDLERAWRELESIRLERGIDPQTDIGAYFYLAGWQVGRDTLEQRREEYASTFHCDSRTALRRADRGLSKLARLVRHRSVNNRPWVFAALFQSGNFTDVIIRFNMAYETWRPPTIRVNERLSEHDFVLHPLAERPGWYYSQAIREKVNLDLAAARGEDLVNVFIHWPMPVWPTWFTNCFIADPRVVAASHTYPDRGLSLALQWSQQLAPDKQKALVKDRHLWTVNHGHEHSTR